MLSSPLVRLPHELKHCEHVATVRDEIKSGKGVFERVYFPPIRPRVLAQRQHNLKALTEFARKPRSRLPRASPLLLRAGPSRLELSDPAWPLRDRHRLEQDGGIIVAAVPSPRCFRYGHYLELGKGCCLGRRTDARRGSTDAQSGHRRSVV